MKCLMKFKSSEMPARIRPTEFIRKILENFGAPRGHRFVGRHCQFGIDAFPKISLSRIHEEMALWSSGNFFHKPLDQTTQSLIVACNRDLIDFEWLFNLKNKS